MRPITLDELTHYTLWPERMLEGWEPRDLDSREAYERKYASLAEALTAEDLTEESYETARRLEFGNQGGMIAMSLGDRLYAATLAEAMEQSVLPLLRYLRAEAMITGSAVDLGCGYGYLLHELRRLTRGEVDLRGGELTDAGVKLAARLGENVYPFDFLSGRCRPLETAERSSVVTTSFALHQLKGAATAVELLSGYREKIDSVVCLEPVEEHFGRGLLGLLRRRYGQVRGYSADLLVVLRQRRDVRIEVIEEAAVGANALLPASVVIWRFI